MKPCRTVLVVDDSEFVRSYHTCILRANDFEVITAVDGMDALEKLFTSPCDAILTDINMGNMDGYDFIRRVRAEPSFKALPIIIVSTESETHDKQKGFAAGANLYIVKPCAPDLMLEHLKMVLASPSATLSGKVL